MPPTRNGNWAFSETAAKPTTFSHTLNPGSNRVVLIFVSFKDNSSYTQQAAVLNSMSASPSATYNGDYGQAGQFRVRYDSSGEAIDAELIVSVDMQGLSGVLGYVTGFVGVFAVWEADLPATTGAKTIQIDSGGSVALISHVGVIQYDNVLQNAWYSDWTQSQSSSTSHTLNFNTKVANCLLVNFIQTHATNNFTITDNSSQTLEHDFAYYGPNDAKSSIYSKILPGIGDDSVSYTLGSSTTASIAGIVLIPDTETISSARVIRLLEFNRQQQITTSSSDPTISTTLDSGDDRIVIAVLYWDDASSHTINTATFGGQSMTHLGQAGNTIGDTYVSAWYLLEEDLPPDGTQDLIITNPTTLDNWIAGIVILENVSQEVPHDFTALTDRSRSLTLSTITPTTEHCWLFQLWSSSSAFIMSTDVGGMDIWNVRASGQDRSRFITGSLSHDRSVTPTIRDLSDFDSFSGLGFWVSPSQIVDVESSEHLHISEEVRPIISPEGSEHAHTSGSVDVIIDPEDSIHDHTSEEVQAILGNRIGGSVHIHTSNTIEVLNLRIEDSLHNHTSEEARLLGIPEDSVHAHTSEVARAIGVLKFSTHRKRPDTNSKFKVFFLELVDDIRKFPEHEPLPGKYEKVITEFPTLSKQKSGSQQLGVRTLEDLQVRISNKNKIFRVDGGDEFINLNARAWVRQNGISKKVFQGKVASLNIDSISDLVLKDAVRSAFFDTLPQRFINTTDHPRAKDLGRPISIAVGRVPRLPCYNMEWDDANRIYRWSLGEGIGLNDGNWSEIFAVYKGDLALRTIQGTVDSNSSADVIRLEDADRRPDDFYNLSYIDFLDGLNAGEIRDITDYASDNNRVTVSSDFSNDPQSGDTYRIREFRFYDGSQSSPFSGIAVIEFKKPFTEGTRILDTFADVDALQDEKNFARFIQSLLSNDVWGKGLDINLRSFDDAATELVDLDCEGVLNKEIQVIDLMSDLSKVRGISLR